MSQFTMCFLKTLFRVPSFHVAWPVPRIRKSTRRTHFHLVWLDSDCTIKFWTLHCILITFGPLYCSFGPNQTITWNDAEVDDRRLFFLVSLSLCYWRNPWASDSWGSNHHYILTSLQGNSDSTRHLSNPLGFSTRVIFGFRRRQKKALAREIPPASQGTSLFLKCKLKC